MGFSLFQTKPKNLEPSYKMEKPLSKICMELAVHERWETNGVPRVKPSNLLLAVLSIWPSEAQATWMRVLVIQK